VGLPARLTAPLVTGDSDPDGTESQARARRSPAPAPSRLRHPKLKTWLKHSAVLAHLDVDSKTLRARMRENPPAIEPAWINIGSDRRPEYRWVAEQVDNWWIEVNRWRVSTNAVGSGGSAGATRTARRGAARAPTRPRRSASSPKSSRPSPKDDDGSLVTLVRSLTSG
jgi:hypothetical protein